MNQRKMRVISLVMSVIVLVSLVYSVLFIAVNAHHCCCSEDCPICEQLQVAENLVHRISTAVLMVIAAILICDSVQLCNTVFQNVLVEKSPIQLKVKMQH